MTKEELKIYQAKWYQDHKVSVLNKARVRSNLPNIKILRRYTNRKCLLIRLYNLTYVNYLILYKKQDFKCAICRRELNGERVVDHCHLTGRVRGLLCSNCNAGLGMFRDNVEFLDKAKEYLNEDK